MNPVTWHATRTEHAWTAQADPPAKADPPASPEDTVVDSSIELARLRTELDHARRLIAQQAQTICQGVLIGEQPSFGSASIPERTMPPTVIPVGGVIHLPPAFPTSEPHKRRASGNANADVREALPGLTLTNDPLENVRRAIAYLAPGATMADPRRQKNGIWRATVKAGELTLADKSGPSAIASAWRCFLLVWRERPPATRKRLASLASLPPAMAALMADLAALGIDTSDATKPRRTRKPPTPPTPPTPRMAALVADLTALLAD